jgi:hypothetical protein
MLGIYPQILVKTLNYTSSLKVASLHAEETPAVLTEYLPLSMAVMGPKREYAPGALLKEYSDGPLSIAKTAHIQIHNRAMIELAFADKGKTVYRFFLDPQQGYLPKEAIRYAPKQTKEEVVHAYLLEAKECTRNRWFPMHTVRLLLPSRKPVSVVDIRVTELEVDKRPAASDFAVTIPAGTAIKSARQDIRQFFYLKQQEEMNPDDIPRLFQMLEDAPKQPLMDTAVHAPGWSNKSYVLAGSAVGLLFVGGALWCWRRRHRAEIRRSDL